MMRFSKATTLLSALAMSCATAWGMFEIRIDLSTEQGSSAFEGTWNVFNSSSLNDETLVDLSTGNDTGATISTNFGSNNGSATAWLGAPGSWLDGNAGNDLFYTTSSATVTLDGMGTSDWKIEIASAWNSSAIISLISILGDSADSTGNGDPVPATWNADTDGEDNWLIWSNVTPVAGAITIDVSKAGGVGGGISALRLTQVPEPGAWTLLAGICALGLAVWRVQRKK